MDESFAGALDAAISDAGLTLDRLREHLAARGVPVSRSALAYWRHGRSRPGRETSVRAVVELEQVLGLAPGALTALLGPAERRLPPLPRTPLRERRRLWPSVRPVSLELKPPPEDQLRLWSVHDRLVVDERRASGPAGPAGGYTPAQLRTAYSMSGLSGGHRRVRQEGDGVVLLVRVRLTWVVTSGRSAAMTFSTKSGVTGSM
ncbi:hypothetical protein [Amycolatopsis sp. NPDC049159]|uniref:hypothetical protein n=1 Tax=Amycolatopsis sp. NPDC049159 TaxID=3157210 RepID=UPI0034061857